jgi:hypothetical protein
MAKFQPADIYAFYLFQLKRNREVAIREKMVGAGRKNHGTHSECSELSHQQKRPRTDTVFR